ncbi:ArdC family protein [Sulfitobacter sp.]|uniref:ArdC family protein n=1 Tax=Sulfitobacter sp. TaxID=1903071 RepID=UPI0030018C3E
MPKIDIHQHVTDMIIAQMEAGTPPWRKPWTEGGGAGALPLRHNGEPYRGVNILMLWASAEISGFTSERWMTFKQATDLGGSVIKGSKCARSVFYGTFEKDNQQTEDMTKDAEGKTRIPFAKCNNVFNADQIEGLPDAFYILPEPARDLGTRANPDLEAFFAKTGADIVTTSEPRAYYRPSKDQVHMPPIATFFEAARYYGVLAHELTHWTGAPNRLDRIEKYSDRCAYAFEELVAEIGACILGVKLGIGPEFDQSAAYIENWLEALKNDKGLIFKAASEAQKAVDFIMDAGGADRMCDDEAA